MKRRNVLLGHLCVLQDSNSDGFPVHFPPWASFTDFLRVCVRVPTPQGLLHDDQDSHLDHWQSTTIINNYS